MYFINVSHGIPYPDLQEKSVDISNSSYKIFPEEYLGEFYKSDKRKSGFVTFKVSGNMVENVKWNETAYQEWVTENPEPEPEPEPEPIPSEDIKEETKAEIYTEMATAYREGVESIG